MDPAAETPTPPAASERDDEFVARVHMLSGQGDAAAAAQLCREALQRQPDRPAALYALGMLAAQARHFDEAVGLLQRAADLAPAHATIHLALGQVLDELRRHEEALQCIDRALELEPGLDVAHELRSRVLQRLHRPVEALHSIDRALHLRGEDSELLVRRAHVLRLLGSLGMKKRREEAVQTYRRAIAVGGDAERIGFFLAAMGAAEMPAAAPASLVARMFDDYAHGFDEHLLQGLAYRAPALLDEALQGLALPPVGLAIDLGCGTGLCGPLLRPRAQRLVGVDLSPRMLEHAAARGVYDELVVADITSYLRTLDAAADLLAAADVLVYIGDLDPLFAAARRALRPGGRFAFTVEAGEGEGFMLHAAQRYAHADAYLDRVAAAHGLHIELRQPAVLRLDAGVPVEGRVLVLRG